MGLKINILYKKKYWVETLVGLISSTSEQTTYIATLGG